ncbi:hypothetical protein EPUS_07327 [Endocarpon pusillum Z07020]|uniref:Uncharacterized protein n=1 Tax=Endocarpon pusillum (strain Z07020 / HMAS-L-300199) TaxID=1263415 RepID=U1GFM3_ENDPU|nr:uncharacterized protein EPUS_07327 [Endocarpon pusillum Z07020]ERF76447.1 hypothetical protein EPUS_07327 [Endocarpon pusillum Z07020]
MSSSRFGSGAGGSRRSGSPPTQRHTPMTREGAAETAPGRGAAVKDPVSGNQAPVLSIPSDSRGASAGTAATTHSHPSSATKIDQPTADQLLIDAAVNDRASAEDRKLYAYKFTQDTLFRAQVLEAYRRYRSAKAAAERRKADLLAGIILVFAPELASLFVYEPHQNPSADELVLRLRATSLAHQVAGEALTELENIGYSHSSTAQPARSAPPANISPRATLASPVTPLGSTPRAPRPSARREAKGPRRTTGDS